MTNVRLYTIEAIVIHDAKHKDIKLTVCDYNGILNGLTISVGGIRTASC